MTAYSDLHFITKSSLFWGLALLGGRVGPLALLLLLGGLVLLQGRRSAVPLLIRLHRSPVQLPLIRGLLLLLLLRRRVLLGIGN